jgi:hypothetical protein
MFKSMLTALAAGVGLVASIAIANAQYFNYTTSSSPNPVPSDRPDSWINVFDGATNGKVIANSTTGTDIVLSNFTTTSSAPNNPGAHFNANYSVDLTMHGLKADGTPTGFSDTHSFAGTFTGNLGAGSAQIFYAPTGKTSFTFNLGTLNGTSELFAVDLGFFTSPGSPTATARGALSAHVTGPVSSQALDTPEPGSLALLFGMGLSGTLFIRRRRSR